MTTQDPSRPVRILILGTGSMAKSHVEAYADVPGAEVFMTENQYYADIANRHAHHLAQRNAAFVKYQPEQHHQCWVQVENQPF